ncbi:MAG: radical SAM protein [Candidatus Brocadiae bacterium]|nr:radical SAM protein [Candidatus Brocadiia bacterium]
MEKFPKKCYVNFLGCEKRKLDTQRIWDYLKKNGYTLTPKVTDADIVIFVTCAFCSKYEDWSITKMQKLYRQRQENATFIICGCLTSIHPKRLKEYFPDAILVGTRELEKLDELLSAKISISKIPDPNITLFDKQNSSYDSLREKSMAQQEYEKAKKGFKIRINWGCLGNCSFCVTKYAEKELASKPLELVLKEFHKGLSSGHTSFFFTGGDTGAYGQDISLSIVSLMTEILAPQEQNYKVHFHDFGVHWLHAYFAELLPLFQKNRTKLGCFSLPVQSGSNHVLKLMKRPYTIEPIQETLIALKKQVPEIQIGTHLIAGFPGESEEDFEKTMLLVKSIPWDFCNVFPYSTHPAAESTLLPNQIPQETILNRYNLLFDCFEKEYIARSSRPQLGL